MAYKVFVNPFFTKGIVPSGCTGFLEYIRTGKASDDLSEKINNAVSDARKKEKWRKEYMTLLLRDQEKRAEGHAEGLIAGRDEEKINAVKYMLKKGFSMEIVSEYSGYSPEKINELREQL